MIFRIAIDVDALDPTMKPRMALSRALITVAGRILHQGLDDGPLLDARGRPFGAWSLREEPDVVQASQHARDSFVPPRTLRSQLLRGETSFESRRSR